MLQVLRTRWGRPIETATRLLLQQLTAAGECYVLVPSPQSSVRLRKELAALGSLSFGVHVKSMREWISERQEVWGDGRTVASRDIIAYFAELLIQQDNKTHASEDALPKGMAHLLTNLVDTICPFIPKDRAGQIDELKLYEMGLTKAEVYLIDLLSRLEGLLQDASYILPARVKMELIPKIMASQKASFVCMDCMHFSRADREMLEQLAKDHEVYIVDSYSCMGKFCSESKLVQDFNSVSNYITAEYTDASYEMHETLAKLYQVFLGDEAAAPKVDDSVRFVLPAGPFAEAEALSQEIEQLVSLGAKDIVIAAPVASIKELFCGVSPKLFAKDIELYCEYSLAYSDIVAANSFVAFFKQLATLVDSLDTPPEKRSMLWWPPLGICDFLRVDASGVGEEKGYALERRWRQDRRLSAEAVLDSLCSKNKTSAQLVAAVPKLREGKIASAMHALQDGYESAVEEMKTQGASLDQMTLEETRAFFSISAQVALHMNEFGLNLEAAGSLSELARQFAMFATQESTLIRLKSAVDAPRARVRIMSDIQAASLGAATVDAVILAKQSSHESRVKADETVDRALIYALGIEQKHSPIDRKLMQFAACIRAAKRYVSIEYAHTTQDGGEAYPSAMLSTLLAVYGVSDVYDLQKLGATVTGHAETDIRKNLKILEPAHIVGQELVAAAGNIDESAKKLINVVPPGTSNEAGEVYLSASQIETYLECPYKWFATRRVGLDRVDASFSGIEMGIFVHKVLELYFTKFAGSSPSAWTDKEAAAAHATLDEVFSEVLDEQYRDTHLRQALIAHSAEENDQIREILRDLHSALDYQRKALYGFAPHDFELSFGKHGEKVSYAGVQFMGTIDRVDIDKHNQVAILDYKHKPHTGFNADYNIASIISEMTSDDGVIRSLPSHVQSLIYAQIMRRLHPEFKVVASLFLSTKGDVHRLAGAVSENVADLILGDAVTYKPTIKAMVVPDDMDIRVEVDDTIYDVDEPGLGGLLDAIELLVQKKIEAMLRGEVEANPRDKYVCKNCPVRNCEKRLN